MQNLRNKLDNDRMYSSPKVIRKEGDSDYLLRTPNHLVLSPEQSSEPQAPEKVRSIAANDENRDCNGCSLFVEKLEKVSVDSGKRKTKKITNSSVYDISSTFDNIPAKKTCFIPLISGSNVTMSSPDPLSKFHEGPGPVLSPACKVKRSPAQCTFTPNKDYACGIADDESAFDSRYQSPLQEGVSPVSRARPSRPNFMDTSPLAVKKLNMSAGNGNVVIINNKEVNQIAVRNEKIRASALFTDKENIPLNVAQNNPKSVKPIVNEPQHVLKQAGVSGATPSPIIEIIKPIEPATQKPMNTFVRKGSKNSLISPPKGDKDENASGMMMTSPVSITAMLSPITSTDEVMSHDPIIPLNVCSCGDTYTINSTADIPMLKHSEDIVETAPQRRSSKVLELKESVEIWGVPNELRDSLECMKPEVATIEPVAHKAQCDVNAFGHKVVVLFAELRDKKTISGKRKALTAMRRKQLVQMKQPFDPKPSNSNRLSPIPEDENSSDCTLPPWILLAAANRRKLLRKSSFKNSAESLIALTKAYSEVYDALPPPVPVSWSPPFRSDVYGKWMATQYIESYVSMDQIDCSDVQKSTQAVSFELFQAVSNRNLEGLVEIMQDLQRCNQNDFDDYVDMHGNTLLMSAIQRKWKKGVKYLFGEIGMDINTQNNYGNTALHFAHELQYDDVLRYLFKKHAKSRCNDVKVYLVNNMGMTYEQRSVLPDTTDSSMEKTILIQQIEHSWVESKSSPIEYCERDDIYDFQ